MLHLLSYPQNRTVKFLTRHLGNHIWLDPGFNVTFVPSVTPWPSGLWIRTCQNNIYHLWNGCCPPFHPSLSAFICFLFGIVFSPHHPLQLFFSGLQREIFWFSCIFVLLHETVASSVINICFAILYANSFNHFPGPSQENVLSAAVSTDCSDGWHVRKKSIAIQEDQKSLYERKSFADCAPFLVLTPFHLFASLSVPLLPLCFLFRIPPLFGFTVPPFCSSSAVERWMMGS